MKKRKARPDETVDAVALLIVKGIATVELPAGCRTLGIDDADIAKTIAAARRKITSAAEYSKPEQIGMAIVRLNDVYACSIKAGDQKTALTAQRELNRLMDLYRPAKSGTAGHAGDPVAKAELVMIASHLLPLELAEDTYPLHEHARLAAELVRDRQAAKPPRKKTK